MNCSQYWMRIDDHFWFTLEGPQTQTRLELRHAHNDKTGDVATTPPRFRIRH